MPGGAVLSGVYDVIPFANVLRRGIVTTARICALINHGG